MDKLGRAPAVIVDELTDTEIEELRSAAPELAPLLANGHPAREVVRNLFRLDRLLRQARGDPVPRTDRKPILVPIPFGLWHALAYVAEMLPQPPFARNQVELMQIDSVASPGAPGFDDLRISPTSLQDVLPAIVG